MKLAKLSTIAICDAIITAQAAAIPVYADFEQTETGYFYSLDDGTYAKGWKTINDKKYYVRNIDKLILLYTSEMNSNDKIYYLYNGINIDGICVNTSVEKLMLLEKEFNVY